MTTISIRAGRNHRVEAMRINPRAVKTRVHGILAALILLILGVIHGVMHLVSRNKSHRAKDGKDSSGS